MQLINAPAKLVLPFANAGAKNTIPVASQIGIVAGAASLTDGFPPLTRTPLAAGGVPPSGLDMNGIIYELSAILRWANAGGGYVYDGTFAADSNVGGYPKGARVLRSDGLGYWFNTTDNNTTDPEGAGAVAAGWVPDFTNGVAAVTMTNANVTLTALQYGKPIVVISGLLTSNLNLVFPTIAGEWTVINNTTGAFDITCKTAAGTGVIVRGAQLLVGDGTNIVAGNLDAPAVLGALVGATSGSADAIIGTFAPAFKTWINGVPMFVRAGQANATTTPTFSANGLTAKVITKGNGQALVAGDIQGSGHWLTLVYDSTVDKVVLQNPADVATTAQAQALSDNWNKITPLRLMEAFQGANQSLAANGYQKLPGGLIIQWGTTATGAGGTVAVTFPIAFPNASLSVVGMHVGAGNATVIATASSLSSVTLALGASGSLGGAPFGTGTIKWIAVGY